MSHATIARTTGTCQPQWTPASQPA